MSNIRILPILGGGGGDTPTGTIQITENGTYNVAQYASAEVNVSGGGGDPIITFSVASVAGSKVTFNLGVATLGTYYYYSGNYIYWDTDPNFSNPTSVSIDGPNNGKTSNVEVTGLPENTTVYFKAGITVNGVLYYSERVNATTQGDPISIKWYDNGTVKHTAVSDWNTDNNPYVIGISFDIGTVRATVATADVTTDGTTKPFWGDNTQIVAGTGTAADINAAALDMSGKTSADALIAAADASGYQPDWRTDATVTNTIAAGCYPAACCCWRYSTVGTSQGDWYLPSGGEMVSMLALKTEINSALTLVGGNTLPNYMWTSTQNSTDATKAFSSNKTKLYNDDKGYSNNYTRPFTAW